MRAPAVGTGFQLSSYSPMHNCGVIIGHAIDACKRYVDMHSL